MRKMSALVVAVFGVVAMSGWFGSTTAIVGGTIDDFLGTLEIVNTVSGDNPPASWSFQISSPNCGRAIQDGDGALVESLMVETLSGGGQVPVNVLAFPYGNAGTPLPCEYQVTQIAVTGWELSPGSASGLSVNPGGTTTVQFTSTRAADTTVPGSTVPDSTVPDSTVPGTTVPGGSTTVTTTTATPSGTPSAPAPTTIAGATSLPSTGSDEAGPIAAMAALVLIVGLGGLALSRRRPA